MLHNLYVCTPQPGGGVAFDVELMQFTPLLLRRGLVLSLENTLPKCSRVSCLYPGIQCQCTWLRADFGVTWTLAGHSERRLVFGESNEVCAAKAHAALANGMTVVFCVGEELAQREDGSTMTVVGAQLAALLSGLPDGSWDRIIVAYEPVWAIGTGKTASPQQAQDTHADIRAWLSTHASADIAAAVRIAYGGSVKPSNCNELIAQPDVDGFLVGGASLKPDFVDIIQSAALKGQ